MKYIIEMSTDVIVYNKEYVIDIRTMDFLLSWDGEKENNKQLLVKNKDVSFKVLKIFE